MLHVNIVTPERPFLDQECYSVTVPGLMGEMQVLAGHAAILAELKPGVVSLQRSGQQEPERFMVGEGFLEVEHDQVTILVEQARFKSEIDKTQEESLLAELKDSLAQSAEDEAEQKRATAALSRCMARLSLLE